MKNEQNSLSYSLVLRPTLGNLGGVGRNQLSGLSQGILVTQSEFQDKKILDKFVHGNNCQTGRSLLMLEVLEF